MSNAIENASYDTLAWLQKNAAVDLHRIRDADGNGLLHQITKCPHAERFILTAATCIEEGKFDRATINLLSYDVNDEDHFLQQRNRQGRVWLHKLIISGNTRAFELALSPNALVWTTLTQLCWSGLMLKDIRDSSGLNLSDTAHLLGRRVMEKIINKVEEIALLRSLEIELESHCEALSTDVDVHAGRHGCVGAPDLGALEAFVDESPSSVVRRLIRFGRDYGTDRDDFCPDTPEALIGTLAEALCLCGLSWIVDEDPSLLNSTTQVLGTSTSENQNEFAQPELHTSPEGEWLYLTPAA